MKTLSKPDETSTIYKPGDQMPEDQSGSFAICIFTGASCDEVGGASRYVYYLDETTGVPMIFKNLREACELCDKLEDSVVNDTSYGPAHLPSYSVCKVWFN